MEQVESPPTALAITPNDLDANASRLAFIEGVCEALRLLVSNLSSNLQGVWGQAREDSSDIAREIGLLSEAGAACAKSTRKMGVHSPRFARLVAEALLMTGDYRLCGVKSKFLSPEAAKAEMFAAHEANANRLYSLCIELGGGILKLGQFLSCRMDLLPQPYVEKLGELQDRVPPVGLEMVTPLLEKELGDSMEKLFENFAPQPIAAASLGQVHRATLIDGRPVAVKILRPGIVDIVKVDLSALRAISVLLRKTITQLDLKTISIELNRSVRRELNFKREASNAMKFAHLFAEDKRLVLPRIYKRVSSRSVLTMKYIDGVRLTDYLDECANGGEEGNLKKDALMRLMIDHFCEAILKHGFYQADPHPGNFLVMEDGRLAIVDFGSMGVLTSSQRKAYIHLIGATLQRNDQMIVEALRKMGFRTSDPESDILVRYAKLVLEIFDEEASKNIGAFDSSKQMKKMMELSQATRNVKVPSEFVLLGRTLIALGGLIMHYKPNLNLFEIIAPHLQSAFASAR